MSSSELASIHGALKAAFKSQDYAQSSQLFKTLKVCLAKSNLFLSETLSPQVLAMIREGLEIGAYACLFAKDMDGFKAVMSQYRPYVDFQAPSSQSFPLLGLELLCALVEHRSSTFHGLLECLPSAALTSNPYIRGPIELEQALMEGSFNRARKACAEIPGPEYQFFMSLMTESIREELADCIEKSYHCLSLDAANAILFCSSQEELAALIQKRGWTVRHDGKELVFKSDSAESDHLFSIDYDTSIERDLFFARQLEKIV